MHKGAPTRQRKSKWHKNHMKKMAKREHVRKLHMKGVSTVSKIKAPTVTAKIGLWERIKLYFKSILKKLSHAKTQDNSG